MIDIKIPKEINKYEARAAGPFTMRQLLCLLICLPIGIGIFVLSKPYVGTDIAGFLVFIPGGAAYLFGWYKPYGMKFEKYLQTVFINAFFAPSKRLYKTENLYESILKDIEKNKAAEELATSSSRKNKAKKKYKRSKDAIK